MRVGRTDGNWGSGLAVSRLWARIGIGAGLLLGAVDYIVKSYANEQEIAARISICLQRPNNRHLDEREDLSLNLRLPSAVLVKAAKAQYIHRSSRQQAGLGTVDLARPGPADGRKPDRLEPVGRRRGIQLGHLVSAAMTDSPGQSPCVAAGCARYAQGAIPRHPDIPTPRHPIPTNPPSRDTL